MYPKYVSAQTGHIEQPTFTPLLYTCPTFTRLHALAMSSAWAISGFRFLTPDFKRLSSSGTPGRATSSRGGLLTVINCSELSRASTLKNRSAQRRSKVKGPPLESLSRFRSGREKGGGLLSLGIRLQLVAQSQTAVDIYS